MSLHRLTGWGAFRWCGWCDVEMLWPRGLPSFLFRDGLARADDHSESDAHTANQCSVAARVRQCSILKAAPFFFPLAGDCDRYGALLDHPWNHHARLLALLCNQFAVERRVLVCEHRCGAAAAIPDGVPDDARHGWRRGDQRDDVRGCDVDDRVLHGIRCCHTVSLSQTQPFDLMAGQQFG